MLDGMGFRIRSVFSWTWLLFMAHSPSHLALPLACDMARSRFHMTWHFPSHTTHGLCREYPPHSAQSKDTWSSGQLTPHVKHEFSCCLICSMENTVFSGWYLHSSKELILLKLWLLLLVAKLVRDMIGDRTFNGNSKNLQKSITKWKKKLAVLL